MSDLDDVNEPDLDDDDDVAGHLRMTPDQLAGGLSPREVLDDAAERAAGSDATTAATSPDDAGSPG